VSALRLQSRSPQTDRDDCGDAPGPDSARFAHDLNNLLTIVVGAVEALADNLPDGSVNQNLALVSLRAAECGAGLVRRMLDAARPTDSLPPVVDCTDLIAGMRPMTASLLGEGVKLSASSPPYPLACFADAAELQSALLNLCINARDAMPGGGAIVMRADCRWMEGAAAEALGLAAGSYVVFTVSDTGTGMSPQTLKRALEPHFTTKGEAGNGLGLCSVEAFARRFGGGLSISSRLDFGTTVQLYLPRAQTRPATPRFIDLQAERNPS